MKSDKDQYYLAVKVFLEDQNERLLILKDKFGDWDLPGGRLREEDFEIPLEKIIERKIKEELGDNLKYNINEPVVFMRHERNEVLSSGEKAKRRIFAIGYRAQYLNGEITMGNTHTEYKWVNISNFDPSKLFYGGWLKGVQEYLKKSLKND